jgi:hypothetical protein
MSQSSSFGDLGCLPSANLQLWIILVCIVYLAYNVKTESPAVDVKTTGRNIGEELN